LKSNPPPALIFFFTRPRPHFFRAQNSSGQIRNGFADIV
jgi:hypothetical protein